MDIDIERCPNCGGALKIIAASEEPGELGEDEILVAIVLKPAESASAEEIATWCRHHLAPQKVPRFVLFVDELPHTPTHKVAKAVLKEQAAELQARAVDLQC